jgi:hypothetical protein
LTAYEYNRSKHNPTCENTLELSPSSSPITKIRLHHGTGSHDLRVADRAAELWLEGWAPVWFRADWEISPSIYGLFPKLISLQKLLLERGAKKRHFD